MMKNIYLISIVGLVMAGCASKVTDVTPGTSSNKSSSKAVESVTPPAPAKSSNTAAPQKIEPVQEVGIGSKISSMLKLGGPLDEAIQAQADDKIFTAASDAIAKNPSDTKALNAMAMYHYKKGRFELAEYLLRRGIKTAPKAYELHNNLGVVLLATDQRREAVVSFRQALALNSSDPVASANVGAIYVKEKDYNKAVIALSTAVSRGGKDPRNTINYAIALGATGKGKEAQRLYKDLLKDNQNNREVLLNYSILLVDVLGEYQEGLDTINRLKFVGGPAESRQLINALENKAKAGLK